MSKKKFQRAQRALVDKAGIRAKLKLCSFDSAGVSRAASISETAQATGAI